MATRSMLAQGRAAPIEDPAFGVVAGLASMGVFLVALELTIVAVALPALATDLRSLDDPALAWVFSGYNIAVASLLLLFGWLADRHGRRTLFVAGLGVFAVGSAVSGLAASLPVLVTGRVMQGVGGAMMMPASLGLLLALIDSGKRNQAIAVWGASAGLAAALGPVIGGVILHLVGWRGVFLFNVPVALLIAGFALRLLPESKAVPLSVTGSQISSAAQSITAMVRDVTRIPSFCWASLASFPLVVSFTAWVVLAPGFLHVVWRYPLESAGLAIVPAPLMMVVAASPAAALVTRLGYRKTIALGAICAALALLWWYARLTVQPAYVASFLPGAVLFGTGLGLAFPMLAAAAVRDVPQDYYASASAGLTTVRQLAMAAGAALAIAVVSPALKLSEAPLIGGVLEQHQNLWLVCAGLLCVAAVTIARFPDEPEVL